MASKPAIVIITGSFSLPSFYTAITEPLTAKGYEVHIPQLTSVGKKPGPLPTMADDAAMINQLTTKLADEGKDILLIAHSYGGVPSTESIRGVSKTEREKAGKKGGVARIGYLSAVTPPVGSTSASVLADIRPDPNDQYIKPDEDGWLYHPDPAQSATIVFNDLSPEEGTEWVKKFPNHSSASFAGELTYGGYKEVLISWLLCENDKTIPPSVQEKEINMIEEASGKKVDVTRIPTDHVPPVGAPEKVIAWIEDAAAKC